MHKLWILEKFAIFQFVLSSISAYDIYQNKWRPLVVCGLDSSSQRNLSNAKTALLHIFTKAKKTGLLNFKKNHAHALAQHLYKNSLALARAHSTHINLHLSIFLLQFYYNCAKILKGRAGKYANRSKIACAILYSRIARNSLTAQLKILNKKKYRKKKFTKTKLQY